MKCSSYFKDITLSVERRNNRKLIAGVVERPGLEATTVNMSERGGCHELEHDSGCGEGEGEQL